MPQAIKYRPDIDGLRAVAVVAVVLHHLWPKTVTGGYVGVDIFFVISGFLITKIINREMTEGRFTFSRFYQHRIRRIFPALFAMLAVVLVTGWFLLLPSDYLSTFRAALGTVFFSSNFVFWRELAAGYFASDAKLNPLLHTWSLAVEEQFYILFPLLLMLCHRYAARHIKWIFLALGLLTFLASILLIKSHPVAVFFLSPFRAWELMAGALLALNALPIVTSHLVREWVAAAGLMAILCSVAFYTPNTTFPGWAALLPVLGATAVVHAGSGGNTFVGRVLAFRPVVYIGLISYSFYLWHWPLIVFAKFAAGMRPIDAYLPILLLVSLLLAALSYQFIERPFRHSRPGAARWIFFPAIATALLLMLAAGVGLQRSGFPGRFDAQTLAYDAERHPEIPFKKCDASTRWCTLGSGGGGVPTILFWGDSHMLAWGPAIDRVMKRRRLQAFFVVNSACPPVLGVDSPRFPGCSESNQRVMNFLAAHREVKTVALTAFWKTYFVAGTLVTTSSAEHEVTSEFLRAELHRTLSWLDSEEKEVILLGDVPAYVVDVPLSLALERVMKLPPHTMMLSEHRTGLESFFAEVMHKGQAVFVDPATWMCDPSCEREYQGVSLYRDAHHLSVAGAMRYSPELGSVFDMLNTRSAGHRLAARLPPGGQTE